MSGDRVRIFSSILATVSLIVVGAACASSYFLLWPRVGSDAGTPEPVLVTPRGELADAERSTVELFRNASPSVVFITKLSVRRDLFRRNTFEIPDGTGSGFVWDRRGHIVTNYHVIQGASAAQVTLSDQSIWPAELVGFVAEKDLAVLRIEAPAELLTPLPIGTSHDLSVGQHVFAIGNPFGLDHTLSTGVISGLDREIMGVGNRPIQGVIQTDAAINPGNSGGPLLDSAGRLIGVNTAIFSPSGAYAGIGFAVPVDTVTRNVPQLITHGRVVRPGLGVHLAELPLMRRLGVREGALVLGLQPGSPAAAAGILPTRRDARGAILLGDVIIGVDDEDVEDPMDLFRILDRREVGDRVELRVRRGRSEVRVTIELAGLDAQ